MSQPWMAMTAPFSALPGGAGAGATLRLPPDPGAVRRARAWVVDNCGRWNLGDLCHDAVVVVSELVSNGVRHAGTELLVELTTAGDGAILISVIDWSTRPVRALPTTPLDEAGRGLWLVDTLSTRWGVTAWRSGKRVWAKLSNTAP